MGAPRTAKLLQRHLPSSKLPYIHYNTEEVVFFLLAPGSSVRLHNGGSNVPLNLSLGLRGCADNFIDESNYAAALSDLAAMSVHEADDACPIKSVVQALQEID